MNITTTPTRTAKPTEARKHFKQTLDTELADWKHELNIFRNQTKVAADHLTAEAYVDARAALEILKKGEQDMDVKLVEFQNASDEVWESMKLEVEHAWTQLKKNGADAIARFDKPKPAHRL